MRFQLLNNNGKKVVGSLTNFINENYTFWHRWIGALKKTPITVKITWAKKHPYVCSFNH